MEKGYVYLLLCIESDGVEHHKIGITKRDIKTRISELQTGNQNKISLLKFYYSKNYLKIERWLHRKYNFKNINGEWFILSDEEVFNFVNECDEINGTINYLLENNEIYKNNGKI